jgi:hypothetical protein
MKTFKSAARFAEFLGTVVVDNEMRSIPVGLHKAAALIQTESKAMIGSYQGTIGPFPAWASLSDATLNGFTTSSGVRIPGKIELGYSPGDNPLLRTGQLRDSIEITVHGEEAVIGSNDPVAKWQELGTPDAEYPIPPRSFLGAAAFREEDKAIEAIIRPVINALIGKKV